METSTPTCPRKPTVCRNLFGPVEHEDLWSDSDFISHIQEKSLKWDFDFTSETPMEEAVTQNFEWSSVAEEEYVPDFYRRGVHKLDSKEKIALRAFRPLSENCEGKDKVESSLTTVLDDCPTTFTPQCCSTPRRSSIIRSKSTNIRKKVKRSWLQSRIVDFMKPRKRKASYDVAGRFAKVMRK